MLNEETPEVFMLETIFEGLDQYYYLDLGREVMKGHKLALRESEKFKYFYIRYDIQLSVKRI